MSETTLDPQDRSAGRDTDEAIAIHVMGWFYQSRYAGPLIPWDNYRPSTNLADAWLVLEHFTYPQFYTRLVRTDTGNWRCDIELNGGDGPTWSAWAETAPLAICRAALAAVGV